MIFREAAARAAIKLWPGPTGAVTEISTLGSPRLVEVVLQAVEKYALADSEVLVRRLLYSENADVRAKAVSFLWGSKNKEGLADLLQEYMSRPPYYYNVICWIDRLAYASDPLRVLYEQRLNAVGYHSGSAW